MKEPSLHERAEGVLSSLQDAMMLLSGAKRAARTQLVCWFKENWNFCLCTDHIFTLLSSEAVARYSPSNEKSTERTVAGNILMIYCFLLQLPSPGGEYVRSEVLVLFEEPYGANRI